jgi:hypothetical protein
MRFTSQIVSQSATYSDMVLEKVIVGWPFDFQEIGAPETKNAIPVAFFLCSLSPA